jgi:hypothetical protein
MGLKKFFTIKTVNFHSCPHYSNIPAFHSSITNMLLKINLKRLFLLLILLLFAPHQTVLAETSREALWQHIESRHTIIKCETLKDLERFGDNIDYSPGEWGLKNLFSFSGSKDPIVSLKEKVDAVFERVQEILDMHKNMEKVVIIIYTNNKRFYEARTQIIRENLIGKNSRIRSWYIFKQNAIYINADDIHEGILAHEMAHAIIDHYLTIRPPRATAEILARYVDKHLYY